MRQVLSWFLLVAPTSSALHFPLPPWRGPRQLLHIGPMGVEIDLVLSKFRERRVLHVDLTTNSDPSPVIKHMHSLSPVVHPDAVRVVLISDTHSKHHCVRIPKADVLVHCGDVLLRYGYLGTKGSSRKGLAHFDEWLGRQPAKHKVMIAGNHDRAVQKKNWQPRNALLLDGTKIHKVAGLLFFGSPYSPLGTTSNDAFQNDSLAQEHAAVLDEEIDVLVTHARCSEFDKVASNHARVWAHGHFHDHYGVNLLEQDSRKSCLCVNAATCDMIYRPVNPPIVLDLVPSQGTK